MFAWDAYSWARCYGLPVPEWVHGYFDVAWRNLMFLRKNPPGKGHVAGEIQAALGFVLGGVTVAENQNRYKGRRVPVDFVVKGQGRVSPYLRKKPGAYNPFAGKTDEFALAVQIYDLLLNGHKLLYAYEEAEKRCGAKPPAGRRAWMTYRQYFPAVRAK